MQVSGQFNSGKDNAKQGYEAAFSRDPDLLGGTEATPQGNLQVLERVAKEHDYQLITVDGGGWVAANSAYPIVEHSNVVIVPALHAPASQGGHGPRGVLTEVVDLGHYGLHSFSEEHWVTGFRLGNHKGDNLRREGFAEAQSQGLVDAVKFGARGGRTATWAGDVNDNLLKDHGQDPHAAYAILKAGGLISAFEDEDSHDPTHGKSLIDWIGRYTGDKRLSIVGLRVHRPIGFDHQSVSMWVDILPQRGHHS